MGVLGSYSRRGLTNRQTQNAPLTTIWNILYKANRRLSVSCPSVLRFSLSVLGVCLLRSDFSYKAWKCRRLRLPPRAVWAKPTERGGGGGTPLGNTGVPFSQAYPFGRFVERSKTILEICPNLQAKHKENPRSLGGYFYVSCSFAIASLSSSSTISSIE